MVFAAVLSCYGLLPWLQCRPPRIVEPPRPDAARPGPLRRLNERILSAGSIQANTIPSGHAAGAVAIGLAVWSVFPAAGAVLLVIGLGISAATVLGRYHYLTDSVLGIAVAIAAWTF
ncbi:MAG: phosphatase PAP2 family protein [Vicinamibacterales bacterium]